MSDQAIRPFVRVTGEQPVESDPATPARGMRWLARWMTLHLLLAGVGFFALALSALVYLYNLDLRYLDINRDLQIRRRLEFFDATMQQQLALIPLLMVAGVMQWRAAGLLARRLWAGIAALRLAALLMVTGAAIGLGLRRIASAEISGGDLGGLVQDSAAAWQLAGLVLYAQAVLGVFYLLLSLMPPLRRWCSQRDDSRHPALARLALAGFASLLGGAVLLGVTLGVMTDWLYDVPVPTPEPGELLYVSAFGVLDDEWDLFPGSDSALTVPLTETGLPASDDPMQRVHAPLRDDVLLVRNGTAVLDVMVWSTLDRDFRDMDFRVTTQRVSGPLENQFGVVFRYRDDENFLVFRITSDGWYKLSKVEDGEGTTISEWNEFDAIRQADGVNVIRVVAIDDDFRFFVNDAPIPLCLSGDNAFSLWTSQTECFTAPLTYIYHDSTFKQGRVGVGAGVIEEDEVQIAFDDVLIVGPDPAIMQNLPAGP